jgi:hypothetical protein
MVPQKEARGVTAPARRQGKTPVRQWTLGVAGFGVIAIPSGCRFDRPACNTLMADAGPAFGERPAALKFRAARSSVSGSRPQERCITRGHCGEETAHPAHFPHARSSTLGPPALAASAHRLYDGRCARDTAVLQRAETGCVTKRNSSGLCLPASRDCAATERTTALKRERRGGMRLLTDRHHRAAGCLFCLRHGIDK